MTVRRDCCVWCRRRLEWGARNTALQPTRDHVVAASQGGRAKRWCCRACNELKGDMTPFQWERFRDTVPNWWALFPNGTRYRGIRLYAVLVEGVRSAPHS